MMADFKTGRITPVVVVVTQFLHTLTNICELCIEACHQQADNKQTALHGRHRFTCIAPWTARNLHPERPPPKGMLCHL
jgi:hypothetical protein